MPTTPSAIRKVVLLAGYQNARIAILTEGQEEWHRWSSCIPAAWAPATVADAELVLCVGQQDNPEVGTCEAADDSIGRRTASLLRVTLREARTGVVDQDVTLRHDPDSCPFFSSSASDIDAPPFTYRDVEQWLTPLIQRGP